MNSVFPVFLLLQSLSSPFLGVGTPLSAPGNRTVTEKAVVERSSLESLDKTLSRDAVDARVDRVWHAVPGLAGWRLDVPASEARTRTANDGKVHLVWQAVLPQTRLAALPPEPVYRGPKEEKSVSLMFNVSWGEEYIPSLLDTLKQQNVKATFFLDGAWVKKHPDLTAEIAKQGHAIGSHGFGHPDFKKLSPAQMQRQILRANSAIEHVLGRNPCMLAPPAGSYNQYAVEAARRHGMYTILWTRDTVDWRRPPASAIVSRGSHHIEPGTFLLMHPTAPTAQALPQIIQSLANQGFVFKTVEQVVDEVSAATPPSTLSMKP
ncbi:polysaccharide deacetylase family protein [Alicyclobacillus tolerans]|uniref:polysaccharide deacetylase family protein n=1 Tax=Alicyclobacillus tolerans TaxID=90970 RepID=UPI001F02E397|nr:polysaccharide deacetylase family protein [Alicyclobacillus tolerans]MCF8564802.1 polysaccharide deacetylase family protein [Alicyclobacillus tolerans]